MKLLGAVLAGGQATRFGSDKAMAMLHGRTLIDRAAGGLQGAVDQIVICGRADASDGLVAIADQPAPHLGPLGGLCGALGFAAANDFDAVLSIGCDIPFLPSNLLGRLLAPGESSRFVQQCPIVGYWSVSLADRLVDHLTSGGSRSVSGWAQIIGAEQIDAGQDIPNINRPDDLRRMTALHE